jgi:hypothetical protein
MTTGALNGPFASSRGLFHLHPAPAVTTAFAKSLLLLIGMSAPVRRPVFPMYRLFRFLVVKS